MPEPQAWTQQIVGCDVSKDTIAVFNHATGITVTLANKPAALKAWTHSLDPAFAFVVCETTGGYEALLLDACMALGIKVHRAHARQVKAFIASLGTIAKTDAIDARALAAYGFERQSKLALWTPPDPVQAELYSLVQRRIDMVQMRTQEKNRAKAPGAKPVKPYIDAMIEAYTRQIEQIDDAIKALTAKSKELADRIAKLTAIKGLGAITAATIAALMPELGAMTRRQAASLAGLAPHPRQSGTKDAYRKTKGGRPDLKAALFMAAMVAKKHNPDIKPFYDRLIKNGKKPIVATIAAMRKLIMICNANLKPTKAHQVS